MTDTNVAAEVAADAEAEQAEMRWIAAFAEHAASSEAHYNALDQKVGDGDFGSNLALGGRLTQAGLRAGADRPMACIARVFLDEIGGSSGPLFGLLFGNIERATRDGVTASSLALGAREGRDAIVRVGHAELEDKTLVDALTPIVDALQGASDLTPGAALAAAAAAGEAGAERTRGFRARRGRASYVGDRAIGEVDPGAVAVARFFRVGADAF